MKIRDNLGQVLNRCEVQNTVLVTVNIGVLAMVVMMAVGAFVWRVSINQGNQRE